MKCDCCKSVEHYRVKDFAKMEKITTSWKRKSPNIEQVSHTISAFVDLQNGKRKLEFPLPTTSPVRSKSKFDSPKETSFAEASHTPVPAARANEASHTSAPAARDKESLYIRFTRSDYITPVIVNPLSLQSRRTCRQLTFSQPININKISVTAVQLVVRPSKQIPDAAFRSS